MRTLCFLVTLVASSPVMATGEFKCNYSGNQQEMNACALQGFKKADQALNDEYKNLMATLSQEKQDTLRRSQRGWLKKRDPQCREAVKDSEGGSIWALEFNSCREKATVERTKVIKQWPTKH